MGWLCVWVGSCRAVTACVCMCVPVVCVGGVELMCVCLLCVGHWLAVKLLPVRLRVRACSSDATSQWLHCQCVHVLT